MFVRKRPKINEKEAGVGPFKKKNNRISKVNFFFKKTSGIVSHSADPSDQDFSHSVSFPHGFLGPIQSSLFVNTDNNVN